MENVSAFRDAILAVDTALAEGRFSDARDLAMPYAEAGHSWAETCIGTLYLVGLGVENDYSKAVSYLSAAAERGHGGAWYTLGQFYAGGGGERDTAKSEHCLKKARELGYFPGMALPGVFDGTAG